MSGGTIVYTRYNGSATSRGVVLTLHPPLPSPLTTSARSAHAQASCPPRSLQNRLFTSLLFVASLHSVA
ncbi:unnamed protein product [Leptosia nina]|uniref:Uncharacterized protein n=1 Tax=Leptosia nina TaxID=320188 RepID=A0AAV1J7G2_9NEOP